MKIRNIIGMLLNIFKLSALTLEDKITSYFDKGLRYINKMDSPRYIKSEECKEIKDMYIQQDNIDEQEDNQNQTKRNRYGFPKY